MKSGARTGANAWETFNVRREEAEEALVPETPVQPPALTPHFEDVQAHYDI
jgi:hypothetical protein